MAATPAAAPLEQFRKRFIRVEIPDAQYAAFRRVAEREDRSISSMVRRLIKEAVEEARQRA